MRARILTVAAIALLAAGLGTIGAGRASAGGEGWVDDLEAAKATAKKEGKDLLLDFTGSDWCVWCERLDAEVFSQEAFKTYAKENLVLVVVDFPQGKKLPEKTRAQNEGLASRFDVSGFPTVLLLDADGRPYGRTGYERGGAEKYVESLKALAQKRAERDAALAKAEAATDPIEKAKALDEALRIVEESAEGLTGYEAEIARVVELDAQNAAGFKQKYEKQLRMSQADGRFDEAETMVRGGQFAEAIPKLQALADDYADVPELAQKAWFIKAFAEHNLDQKDAAIASLTKARDIDPENEIGRRAAGALEQLKKE